MYHTDIFYINLAKIILGGILVCAKMEVTANGSTM